MLCKRSIVKAFVRTISLATGAMLLLGCANLSTTATYQTPQNSHHLNDISHLSEREKADLYENIIAADLASANQQFELATSYYLAAARASQSIDLIKLTIQTARQTNDGLALLQASEMWLKQSPLNADALKLKLAGLLSHQGVNQATELTKTIFKNLKDKEERANLLVSVTEDIPLPAANAYLTQVNGLFPKAVSVLFAKANFLVNAAKHTKNPQAIVQQAISFINNALTEQENFLPAIELKTRLLYQAKQDQKAEAMLRDLSAKYPKSQEINALLGQLLYDLRKYDLAKIHYFNWLKNNPSDHAARFFLAASYFATSDFELALESYKQVIDTDYKPQLSYFFCGNAASQVKDYQQAIECYGKVNSGQYFTRSKIELAKVYALIGEIDDALAVVRDPSHSINNTTLAQLTNIEVEILYQHVDKQLASSRINKAMVDHPNDIGLLFKKVRFDGLLEKPKALIELLRNAETKVTNDKDRHPFNLAIAGFLRNNGLYQQSVDWLNDALERKPDDRDYLYARALYKEPLGLVDEMISEFKYLLTLDPTNANIKNALGYTLVDVNQELEYAGQLIEQAYLAMPNNAAVIDSKGWLAYRRGALDQAIKYLNLAFQLAPSADVAVHIGEVYWKKGLKEKAKVFWIKAKKMDESNFLLADTIKKFGVELNE